MCSEPELSLVGESAAADAVVELLRARHVVGMQQPLPRADVRFDLVLSVAEHLLPAPRIDDVAGQQVPVPHAFLRSGERERQSLLAFAKDASARLRSEISRSDEHDGWRMIVEQSQARHRDLDVAGAAVRLRQLLFEGCDVLAGGGACESLHAQRAARRPRRGKDIEKRPSDSASALTAPHSRAAAALAKVMVPSWPMSMPSGVCSIRVRYGSLVMFNPGDCPQDGSRQERLSPAKFSPRRTMPRTR